MSNRHRRTRIYGANYDIGESYYKKQLNDLDNKKTASRSHDSPFEMDVNTESKLSPKVKFLSDDLDFSDNSSKIMRSLCLNNTDNEEHIIPGISAYKENDLDEYIKSSAISSMEYSIENDRHRTRNVNNSSKFLGRDEAERNKSPLNLPEKTASYSLRTKFVSENSNRKENIEEENASRRAVASKARLLDLEEQIMSMNIKQNEREKRNRDLKTFLSKVSITNELE